MPSARDITEIFRFRGSDPERKLFALMLGTAIVVTVDKLDKGGTPTPGDFAAWFAVYLILTFASEFGQDPARIALAIAALSFIGLLLAKGSVIIKIMRKLAGTGGGTPLTDETPQTGTTGDTGFSPYTIGVTQR